MTSPDAKSELQTGRVPALMGRGMRVGLVCARFNDVLTRALLERCYEELARIKVTDTDERWVPGAFELPLAAKAMADTGSYDAVIVLGAVVRGDTPHFDYVAGECAAGVMRAQLESGVPIVFGVLTTDTVEQAKARIDKGAEFADGAVEMAQVLRSLQ
ncbi:MAG: 6,7-dimethyl-8-ribityllumazine synthase [Actinomycetota bacterium]|jgi:6,7-dimethyl-8-ribityllumazine synthase|nr:6,7-dimethyl-8-ribityllumazine synthase [Actinomycetota bacterium]